MNIPENVSTWEKHQALSAWSKQAKLSANLVSPEFSKFVEWVFDCAHQNVQDCLTMKDRIPPPTVIPTALENYDKRLQLALYEVVPPRVRQTCLTWTEKMVNSIGIMEQTEISLSPGGMEESADLTSWVRRPGTCRTPKEARDKLTKWCMARRRMKDLDIADLSAPEREAALLEMIGEEIVLLDKGFEYRWNKIKHSRPNQRPTEFDANALQMFLEKELHILEVSVDVAEVARTSLGPFQTPGGGVVSPGLNQVVVPPDQERQVGGERVGKGWLVGLRSLVFVGETKVSVAQVISAPLHTSHLTVVCRLILLQVVEWREPSG